MPYYGNVNKVICNAHVGGDTEGNGVQIAGLFSQEQKYYIDYYDIRI